MDAKGKDMNWNNYYCEIEPNVMYRGQYSGGKPCGLGVMLNQGDPDHEYIY